MKSFRRSIIINSFFVLLFSASSVVFAQNEQAAILPKKEPADGEKQLETSIKPGDLENKTILEDKATEAAASSSSSIRPNVNILGRVGVQTVDTMPLTLSEAIRMALENNNTIEISRDDVRLQDTQRRAILGSYDPVFSVSPTFTRSSTTGSTATKDLTVNSGLSQFLRTGGNYNVFFNNSRNENAFTQAQVSSGSLGSATSAIYSSNYGIRFVQPLLRNFRIDGTRRNLKISKKAIEQSDADFKRQTTDVVTQVQRAYWDLVFSLRDQQNRVANLELTRENLRLVEARIQAGAAAPLARAEVETELANREGDVLLATQQVAINENTLKQLLLRDSTSPTWERSLVPTEPMTFSPQPINMDAAIDDAVQNREELRRLKLAKEINQIDIDFLKNQTKPQIDFNSTFSLNGFARSGENEPFTTSFFTSQQQLALLSGINEVRGLPGINLPLIPNPAVLVPAQANYLFGGFGRSLANTFRTDAPNFSVGVTISFPFRNRTAKANLAGAEIQKNQLDAQLRSTEQGVIVEVRNAVQAVDTARQRVLIARRARENAEIQLDGERRLFESGRSTTFLLFQRENALTNARNAEIRAETDYFKSLADLQRATSTTFEANNIVITSPIPGN